MRQALVIALLATACGGSSDEGSASAEATADPSGCSIDGPRLVFHGALEVSATDVESPRDGLGRVFGVEGEDAVGGTVFWRRVAESIADAAITETGTFDVSQYPNNVSVFAGKWFRASAGTFDVTEVSPALRGTFHLESLQEVDRGTVGAPVAGTVDGCFAAPITSDPVAPAP